MSDDMRTDDYRLLIPEYLACRLDADSEAAFEEQLRTNSGLRAEVEELRVLWQGLALIPEPKPSAALRARFYQKLNALARNEDPGPALRWKLFRPSPQLAIGLALFAVGLLVGRWTHPGVPTGEIAQLHSEIQSMRQMVALSLLDRQSASARLEGVSWSGRVESPDGQVSGALLRALNHDPNVNVRLSSIDALQKFAQDASIREALLQSIPAQESPLVQIALIDTLVQIRDFGASTEIRRIANNAEYNVNVRQRAAWAVQRLATN